MDDGAATAVRAGKSLLAAGVVAVQGAFEKGDCIRVMSVVGAEIARGLARYDASDASRIKGMKSAAIVETLGFDAGPALVHADDLAQV